ncbi:MAG: glycosyltransferase [Lachnospiraceae bacterium]|nr:glycosyltransferase [Lachnospiraceae bacterium]
MEYSVLMTVYKKDNPEYFRKALLSMVKQTKKPDEIVLVKDGPVPIGIQNTINEIDKKYPKMIVQVQLERNVGLGLALNEGIKVCKNELIARMDSDDISLLVRCEKQIEEFKKNPSLDIIGCPVIEFAEEPFHKVGQRNVPLDNESIHKYCRKRDPFNHPTVMYRKSKVEAAGCYGDLRKNQDTELWIKMLSQGAVCANLPEYLLRFRFDKDTYKKRKSWLNTKSLIGIRWRAFRSGFCSIIDFLEVAVMQMAIYLMPTGFQKFVYKNLIR